MPPRLCACLECELVQVDLIKQSNDMLQQTAAGKNSQLLLEVDPTDAPDKDQPTPDLAPKPPWEISTPRDGFQLDQASHLVEMFFFV